MGNMDSSIAFETILSELAKRGNSLSEKGTLFENFCYQILKKAPFFADDVKEVWHWNEFPGNEGTHDTGIDLVVLTKLGTFWAIQCKFYNSEAHVSKADVDSFISAATRDFPFEGRRYHYSDKLVFSTTDSVSENAHHLYTLFGPKSIEECGIDWNKFNINDIDGMKVAPKLTLRPHQVEALNDVLKGFETHDRGKLIMACGTGKTLTSLKIVEEYVREHNIQNANILYLVPSIALLSQTIMAWGTQGEIPNVKFGICSDATAGKQAKRKADDEIASLMPIPSTTEVKQIVEAFNKVRVAEKGAQSSKKIHYFFSTYQSIDVAHEAQKALGIVFDMVICDEAHRTIGSYQDQDVTNISNYSKINDGGYILAKKRLYMTATEKVYSSNAKKQASDLGWQVYSMDDEKVYGPTFHYLSFGQAVSKQLLTDYRLIVMDIRKSSVLNLHLPDKAFETLDDSAKIMGALSALSKKASENTPDAFKEDPEPMHRAVAFLDTIKKADFTAKVFDSLPNDNMLGKEYLSVNGFVEPDAKLITGQDNASEKRKLLDWLKGDVEENHCRILTNARCLSEGVDVPALDAVIFMARKRSQIDIMQAVGRVMRKFGSGNVKRFGYIIIPIVISDQRLTDKTLSNNEDYRVVWQVVQALRSHDDRLDAEINKIGYTHELPSCICLLNAFFPPRPSVLKGERDYTLKYEGEDTDDVRFAPKMPMPSSEELKKDHELFASNIVKHCGNRLYWDDWSKNIGAVTNNIALKIQQQVTTVPKAINEFKRFKKGLSNLLNPSISNTDCINMLAEHLVTLPVIEAIFNQKDIASQNPITKIMASMLKKLSNLDSEVDGLQDFYKDVQETVKGIKQSEDRQDLIKKLFEKFFQYALPQSAEKFGIVYTPIQIVDFIINSVSDVLKNEFNESLQDSGVKILDPFTGTGTFIVRLLEKLKRDGATPDQIEYKYKNDIWCNEIMLMAYYIALINIEDTHGRLNGAFEPFNHAVLADTFQMSERQNKEGEQYDTFEDTDFAVAGKVANIESTQHIRIIISNPPYSVGQNDANNNNANNHYPILDKRIANTYLLNSKVSNVKSMYDSYVRAFRWASDRISEDGIVSFVSNGSYVDNLAFSGFRRELLKEFNHVYVYNLRGNCRSSGEFRRKEGDNIFGEGSRTLICIIVLVKHKGEPFDGYVHYKDIGDYKTREQKLQEIQETGSISNIHWETIYPDKDNDWLNKKSEEFEKFIPLGGKNLKPNNSIFLDHYSLGVNTGKDAWLYNFSEKGLKNNIQKYICFYNAQRMALQKALVNQKVKDKTEFALTHLTFDRKRIKWDREIIKDAIRNEVFDEANVKYIKSMFRPFVKKPLAFDRNLIQMNYQWKNLFPVEDSKNLYISIPAIGAKSFSCLISYNVSDLHFVGASQCFPLYWYVPFDGENSEITGGYVSGNFERLNSISDDTIESFKKKYKDSSIDLESIFFYLYGMLHSKIYREKYANNLQKEMPRIPFLKDFWGYSKIGKALADLHLNYENAELYQSVIIEKKKDDYHVKKIRYLAKDRKDTILFNDSIIIKGIPLRAYDYVVNGRSPIDWVLDQYQYTVDKDSGIVDDPNLYDEKKGGKYIFDLILSLITVSLKTQDLIAQLPEYEEI